MNNINEFMDVDGPEFIQTVNTEIASIRSSSIYKNQKQPVTSISTTTQNPENYSEIAIVDTNFLLSNLGTLNALLDISENRPGSLLVILPWQVILELDGLKSKSIDKENNIGISARKAMKFLELHLREKKYAIRGQRTDEYIDKKQMGDDSILDCCLYFQSLTRKRLTLLSNDRNLCIKVMVHGLDSLSAESKPGLEALLNRVYQGTSIDQHNGIQSTQHHIRYNSTQQNNSSNGIQYNGYAAVEDNDMEIDGDELYADDMMMDAELTTRGSDSSKWALEEELKAPSKPRIIMKDYSSMKPIGYNKNSSWSSIYAPK